MASESPEQRDVLYYFCDESSFLGEEYMTVGGFAVSRNGVGKITKELLAINETKRARGEIKWHNTRKRGVEVRKAYIDHLMKQIASNYIHFHIRFSPMNEYKHDEIDVSLIPSARCFTNYSCIGPFASTAKLASCAFVQTMVNALDCCQISKMHCCLMGN